MLIEKFKLTNDIAYLIGVIIGDGHLLDSTKSKTDPSIDYCIKMDVADKEFLFEVFEIVKALTDTTSFPRKSKIYGNRKQRYYFQIRNKRLFLFLSEEMMIPKGKKSSIVKTPERILQACQETKIHYLSGLFDTDGGFRGKTLGFTSASKELINDISNLLDELDISHLKETWMNKKYRRRAYGLQIRRKEIDKFLNTLKFRNHEKLKKILKRFYEEVPEWSNGIESSCDDVQA